MQKDLHASYPMLNVMICIEKTVLTSESLVKIVKWDHSFTAAIYVMLTMPRTVNLAFKLTVLTTKTPCSTAKYFAANIHVITPNKESTY